ncbi:ABC transporter substrate-binding protein [Paenibacillus sp. PAMC21692]|uniref:ABC transporter substrate-binding protein n=1 Tax=Paenibacillus sp. PAMC21692 TaxID=2762320 RepID=UPI00164CEB39|nr:ABC transporter substrate-binding protein [Paenibacillus sp. PAMC21692]QNK56822.1 ABC transporter substrate-binding protein [Paenibacillus sp. PAMC21692]
MRSAGSTIDWRRLAACLLAGGLLAGTLAGCARNEAPSPQPEPKRDVIRLDYWTPFSGGDNQFMTEMVEQFNAQQDDITIVQTNTRLDDYYSRLRTAILAGNAPDVAIIHTTSMPQFVQNGYIENLTESAREVGLDWNDFTPHIRKATEYDGSSYGVPLDTHALVMYYNKSHLRAAGVLDETTGRPVIDPGPEGFAAFLERIRSAVASDVAPLAMPSTRIDSVWFWWSLYNQMNGGGTFYSESGMQARFDNAKALEALEYVNHLYATGLIPPDINDSFKLFRDGKAAVIMLGMWGTGAFEHAESLDFGVVPLPVLYDHSAAWGDSHTLAIPTKHGMTEEKRHAALTFSRWMVEHGEQWAQAGHVPSMTKVVESKAFTDQEYRGDYAAVANYVAYWPRHVKQWSAIELLIQEFEKMNYKQQTPKQTLENAVRKVNALASGHGENAE